MVCKHRMNFAAWRKKFAGTERFCSRRVLEEAPSGWVTECYAAKTSSGSSHDRGHHDGVVLFRPGDFNLGSSLFVEGGQGSLVGGVQGINLVRHHQRVLR